MILLCSQDYTKHWLFLKEFPRLYKKQKNELWRVIVGTCYLYNEKLITPAGRKYRTDTWKNPSLEDEVFTHAKQHLKEYVSLYAADKEKEPEFYINEAAIKNVLQIIENTKFPEKLKHYIYDEKALTTEDLKGADYEYLSFFRVLRRAKVKSEFTEILALGMKFLDLNFKAVQPLLQKELERCR